MLIEFSVANYRSFKEKVTFSMVAANLVAQDKALDDTNTFQVDDDLKLLKSSAIYGANSSGKSNLAKALSFMKWFMINSFEETQSTKKIDVEHFRLSEETENQPSFFEIVFILDQKQYRYGFEVNKDKVFTEWLFYTPNKRETKLFERDNNNNFTYTKVYADKDVGDLAKKVTRNNALFLSMSAKLNVQIANQILNWLTTKIQLMSGLEDNVYTDYTIMRCLQKDEKKDKIVKLINKLDVGINDIDVRTIEMNITSFPDKLSDNLKQTILKSQGKAHAILINTAHPKFDQEGNYVSTELLDMNHHESKGTQKVFAMAGLLVDTLEDGKVLIIDEFDARLHPLISRRIVDLFNSNETNPNNAQLIFMTHDTNLLSNKLFRRDQIWFTEKNRYGVTDLYSLAEYKVRNDASFEKDYIQGKYGAIPYIGNLSNLIESNG